MNNQSSPVSSAAAGPWVYRPWLDLLVGCGAWSAPLLLLAAVVSSAQAHAWAVVFYGLAMVFNYPHFMATVYRAYHTQEDFSKYRVFTVHLTALLALTAVLAHLSFRLLPWVFTLYIDWSPWHYTGQNFGLCMMFVRRSGTQISDGERRMFQFAFLASYLMLLVSFHTGSTGDLLILSLGLPMKASVAARILLGAAFGVLSALGVARLARRSSLRAIAAPLTLVVTQFLWFVLPSVLELGYGWQVPQTRYSSGILAVLHSAQYLWITSYYAEREARAAGNAPWRVGSYFLTLIAGGIALFIPGPWLVSRLFHYDFTASFLTFTALVNIHHFLLDGAIWKLRDSRIATFLVGRGRAAVPGAVSSPPAGSVTLWLAGKSPAAQAFQASLVALLLLWGGMDQLRFFWGTEERNLRHLELAATLDPYDAALQERIARAASEQGQSSKAVEALAHAVAANPQDPAPQRALAQALIKQHRYAEAYQQYQRMLKRFPRDTEALLNFGGLASQIGHTEEAMGSWRKALEIDPELWGAQLNLAQALDRQGQPAAAATHYQAYLQLVSADSAAGRATPTQIITVRAELADAYARSNRLALAEQQYQSAANLAESYKEWRLESLALARLADVQEKIGDQAAAARSFQLALSRDAQAKDSRNEAIDWFNYGQFLRRQGQSERLALACFFRAEELLENVPGQERDTVTQIARQTAAHLGRKAADVHQKLPALLAEAASVPASAFARRR